MGKPTICICENKDADQLHGNREDDQRLCFRYKDSTIRLLVFCKLLAIFCDCTGWFVSDLVGTQIIGFLMHRLKRIDSFSAISTKKYLTSPYEPRHEKTVFSPTRKQRRRSVTAQLFLCFRHTDS